MQKKNKEAGAPAQPGPDANTTSSAEENNSTGESLGPKKLRPTIDGDDGGGDDDVGDDEDDDDCDDDDDKQK